MDSVLIYSEVQGRLLALADELDAAALDTTVPACPAWTVRQTYAHLAGLCVDVAAGTFTPPATDEVTARQVAEREGRDIAALCDEWRAATPALLDLLGTETRLRYRLPAVDVWTHENDIHGALGMAPATGHADALLDFALTGLGRAWAGRTPGLTVTATDVDRSWTMGEGDGPHWRGTAFELYRALMGRRTPGQIAAMDWTGDPAPILGDLSLLPAAEEPLGV
ncbi:maleylpyruvate isomerase family mycothiol-dependent enzyme [Nocardiopsis lambiniae]|uniref:Maleylpyruvate isomerase family mycothiol-dependent enzyme n=1 Tax=Nocardiopsis lambiniae TaxID=3075539 RepID=A0ABU2M9V7_9ACTN|nr:maleylpyruvate isomerase family mycothiol-dependent enzyme [Nocardiopsis sp. DSM 44743]MDT0329394.1 maleylpyruvate isomerase family mycothiol-dependent enzyme [Nocardiopsis sp. DSM 44743]